MYSAPDAVLALYFSINKELESIGQSIAPSWEASLPRGFFLAFLLLAVNLPQKNRDGYSVF
jgi:hypothetical protein